jgi:pyruvate formate lyase activating enzyme
MQAYLWQPLAENVVKCNLCNHRCVIKPGRRGKCGVRENRAGQLETLVYGKLIAHNVDPIEKKPLFHFLPGSLSYSIATVGCNFKCLFCQNADIAQMPADRGGMIVGEPTEPRQVVEAAQKHNCASISYTYTEPTIYFEFALDTAKIAHARGIKNIFVSNGYMTAEAVETIAPYLDAANVDLKAFNKEFYKTVCGAKLKHVKETLKSMRAAGVWLEVTTLIVPGLNDDPEQLQALAGFLAEDLGTDTPWHVSRFHPTYRLTDRPPTPIKTLLAARKIGLEAGLKYVYTGNIPGEDGENTICYQCGETLIERWGFHVKANRIKNDRCPRCEAVIHGVGL